MSIAESANITATKIEGTSPTLSGYLREYAIEYSEMNKAQTTRSNLVSGGIAVLCNHAKFLVNVSIDRIIM